MIPSPYTATLALIILTLPLCSQAQTAKEMNRFKVGKAQQGVAVDADYFYVINNSSITKHRKDDGRQVAQWDGTADGFKHLNSGIVIKGKLYCANSNFPAQPMAGSIEIFDPKTLKHIGTHSFGIGSGSVTWVDQRDGYWWVGFAQYSGKHAEAGKDTRWTTLVKYNRDWVQLESWIYPGHIIEAFMPMSNSGGTWGDDGLLYCTGHDREEIYVLQLPRSGYTVEHVRTIPTTIHGQGIAIDRSVKDKLTFYGLSERKESSVIVIEVGKE